MNAWSRLRLAWARRRCRLPRQLPALAQPLPAGSTPFTQSQVLVLDFETTGLDPARDRILSAGWVGIEGGRIVFASARELTVRPDDGTGVGQSATIHGILDSDLEQAASEAQLLDALMPALAGAAIAAHAARIERGFLTRLLRRHGGIPLPHAFIDTLLLERRLLEATGRHPEETPGALTLPEARRRHGLYPHTPHSSGADALACAELLLAQVAMLDGSGHVRLRRLC